jgi:hypothetical protein
VDKLRSFVEDLRSSATSMKTECIRAVMLGWMDMTSKLATGSDGTGTLMPGANGGDGFDPAVWGGELRGFVDIYVDVPEVVDGIGGLELARIGIRAEDAIVKELRKARLSLRELLAPRRIMLNMKGYGGRAWFVATPAHSLEVNPSPANAILQAIAAGKPVHIGESMTYSGASDASDPSGMPAAVGKANHQIKQALDISAASKGARMVFDFMGHFDTRYALKEE